MKIVIPDKIDFNLGDRKKLEQIGAEIYDDIPDSEEEILSRISGAEIITVNYFDLTKSMINAAKDLKYVVAPAVGYEWIDVEAATNRKIKVLNCPTWNSQSVAEHAFALTLGIIRQLFDANKDLVTGNWNPVRFMGGELNGKTIGIVGFGKVGTRVAKIAEGFGMKIVYTNSKSSDKELDNLLSSSDIVCLCLPLNNKTHGMIDARRIALFKQTAYFVNVARGAIVDQTALFEALKAESFAGAGLDVFDGEPLKGKVSELINNITKLPNVLATPHIAASTKQAMTNLSAEVLKDIQSCLDDKPINQVN